LLLGEDPRNVDKLWSKMRWAASGAGSMGGIVYNAISGIETALWDLVGRVYGVPIHALLGGKYRDTVRIYADCHAGESLEALTPIMLARRPAWLSAEGEDAMAQAVEIVNPVHGRADSSVFGGEAFTPQMYALRAQ